MVIENIVICMDNSEYMRNEDYIPSRLMAQCEAADVIVQAKLGSHPENQVALVTFSNHEVVANLTANQTKLLTELYKVKCGGSIRFLQGLSVAQLVLKHRLVKTHKCRIIAFVGSPVEVSVTDLQNLAKRFKKENVTLDVIRFGEEEVGAKELRELIETMNGPHGGSNHLVVAPSMVNLADILVSSKIVTNANGNVTTTNGIHIADEDDEDLRAALELSLRESGRPGVPNESQHGLPPAVPIPTGIQDGNQLSDDEQLALAIQLSMQESERNQQNAAPSVPPEVEDTTTDETRSTGNNRQSPGEKQSPGSQRSKKNQGDGGHPDSPSK